MFEYLRRLKIWHAFDDGSNLRNASRESLFYRRENRYVEIVFSRYEGADFTFYLAPQLLHWKLPKTKSVLPPLTEAEIDELARKLEQYCSSRGYTFAFKRQ